MNDPYFKKIATTVIFAIVVILAFLVIKPILLSVVMGILLAFIFLPVFRFLNKYIKSRLVVASIICLVLAVLATALFWYLTPIFIEQSVKIFIQLQTMDLISPLKEAFPTFFASEQFSSEIGSALSSFVNNLSTFTIGAFSNLLLNLPTIVLHFFVVCVTFFFVLKDNSAMLRYLKSILPFSKEVEDKLFEQSRGITNSVIYGQIITGLLQGGIVSLGIFLFGVTNATLLSLLAVIAGVLPIVGTTVVWIPLAFYLFVTGSVFSAVGVFIFGLIASTIDNFLRPLIVSKRVNVHTSVVLVGMIGGVFMFGILGLLIGPLILAYLFTILDIYRNKGSSDVFISVK
jgi:predicted PurR-regulated permease PerM